MTSRVAVTLAALLLCAAVALGAFGAHALRDALSPAALATWQTAVLYHALHALGLLAVGVLMLHWGETRALKAVAALLVAGILLFSGSLYLYAPSGLRPLVFVTPVGGVAFLAAWLALAWTAWRR